MADPASAPPPSLGEMFITSIDTLNGTEIDLRVKPGWNDRPPLITEKGNWRKRDRPEDPALLKGMLRKGIPPVLRCAVWLSNVVSSVHPHQPPEYSHEYRTLSKVRALDMAYENLLKRTISSPDKNTADESTWQGMVTPVFGNDSEIFQENIPLPVKRVMIALDQVLGVIEYSPILPTICRLMLTHMSESYTFCALREMAHAPNWYFPTYHREYAAWVNAFLDILERLHPTTATFYKKYNVWNVSGMAPLFRDFFTTLLPQECALRILDIYTLEGSKVIFRFGVALLVIFKMEQHAGKNNGKSNGKSSSGGSFDKEMLFSERSFPESTGNSNDDDNDNDSGDEPIDIWETLKIWAHDERFNFEFLVKKAYGVHGTRRPRRFPRRNILARIIKMEEERLLNDRTLDTTDAAPSRPLALTDPFVHPDFDRDEMGNYTKKPPQPVLAEPTHNRMLLAAWLPLSLRMTKLQLLFSTNVHGRSLEMFYNRVSDFKHTVLLAEVFPRDGDSRKTIVGWYASQAWRVSPQVYGDGECVLFRISPDPKHWKWHPHNQEAIQMEEDDDNYQNAENNATALLEQFQVSTFSYISMGGNRDGTCGLRFNEDFTRAESSPAEGFDNEPLAGKGGGDLDIGLVEIYGLVRE